MKNLLVRTRNVKTFQSVAADLENKSAGVPGMALVYGKRGLGKTFTALWYATQNNAIYLRAKATWRPTWMMEELAAELAISAPRRMSELFRTVCEELIRQDHLIIIDELDSCFHDGRIIETIRDIHDQTAAPFILIGMEGVEAKIKRFQAMYDRFLRIERFLPLSEEDIATIAAQTLEIPLTQGAIAKIHKRTDGNFRKVVIVLHMLKRRARVNHLTEIDEKDVVFRREAA